MKPLRIKSLFAAAALAGLLAGVVLTTVQQLGISGLILEAEAYEPPPAGPAEPAGHTAWEPRSTLERGLYTALANITLAFGFALLLVAATTWHDKALHWRSGLAWGLAGYLVFFVAPALGLPPKLPGSETAPLIPRQAWWALTAAATATALALLVFARHRWLKIAGAVLLTLPHLLGAPQPAHPGITPPAELTRAFIAATALANALFWLVLGGTFGWLHQRLHTEPGPAHG